MEKEHKQDNDQEKKESDEDDGNAFVGHDNQNEVA